MAEKKIGNRVFKAGGALATQTIILQARIVRFLGPAVGLLPAIFAARGKDATEAQRQAAEASALGAIKEIFDRSEPEAVAQLVSDICEMAEVSMDGGKSYDRVVFDQDFSDGNVRDIIPATVFILQETLGDFFSGAAASGGLAKAVAGSRSMKSGA